MPARTALEALTSRPLRFVGSSWPWRALAYLLSGLALGALPWALLAMTATRGDATAWAFGAGAALVLVAELLLVSRVERVRLRLVDRDPVQDRARRPWREVGYGFALLVALWWVDLAVVALAFVLPVVLLTTPLEPEASRAIAVAGPIVGLVVLPVAAYPVTVWAGTRAALTRAVLFPPDARLGEVLRSRARLVDVFETERRRIERDLHDGAQQRLAALNMSLGMARYELPAGSAAAEHLGEAQEQARLALADLRELLRGIHPRVLTERGLAAAVRDVAGRSPVPVEVDLDAVPRLSAPVEATGYYIVCEALANVAKHSAAARSWVRGGVSDGALSLEVGDDGVGGADPAGHGLTGLADRTAVADGSIRLSSPTGGPTVLRVELPCR